MVLVDYIGDMLLEMLGKIHMLIPPSMLHKNSLPTCVVFFYSQLLFRGDKTFCLTALEVTYFLA